MKKILLVVAVLFFPVRAFSQGYALKSHGSIKSTDGFVATTTGDTTGADFIYVAIAMESDVTTCTFTDTVGGMSNSWTMVTDKNDGVHLIRGFYVQNPAHVGSGHQFKCDSTGSGSMTFPSIGYMAFSGSVSTPLDVQDQNRATSITSMTAGASGVLPTQDNELIITGLLGTTATSIAINPSFVTPDTPLVADFNAYGFGLAYFVQGTAALVNPTWTFGTTMGTAVTDLVSFKGTAPTTPPWYSTSWAHRFPVTITNNEGRPLSYYHPAISFTGSNYTNLNSCAKMDRSDLRVTDADGITLLNFWLEDTTLSNSVMLLPKVPYIPTSTRKIYVYCGNPLAVSVSSATNTIVSSVGRPADAVPPQATIDATASVFNGYGRIGQACNGDLIDIYPSGGNSQSNTAAPLYIKRSTDNGVTWGSRSQLIAGTADIDLGIATTAITTLANCNMIAFLENDSDSMPVIQKYVYSSTDNGNTWTQSASRLSVPSGLNYTTTYSRIVESSPGGTLYAVLAAVESGDTTASLFLSKCTSSCTTASNWVLANSTVAASLIVRDAGQVLDYSEADLAQTANGHFLVVARAENHASSGGDRPVVWLRSTDTGVTWSAPTTVTDVTGLSGGKQVATDLVTTNNCNAGICNVILAVGERALQDGNYFGLAKTMSTDEGSTWSQLFLDWENTTGDMAYSSSILLKNGNIYTADSLGNMQGGASTTANIYGWTSSEDGIANPFGQYLNGVTSNFTVVGADASNDSMEGHSGSDSVKLNNNTGVNAYVVFKHAFDTTGYPIKAWAVNYWSNLDVANHSIDADFLDGTNPNTNYRWLIATADFAADGLPWDVRSYSNGAGNYIDFTVAQTGTVNTGVWNKYLARAKVTSNTVLGAGLSFNNVLAGNNGVSSQDGTTGEIRYFGWISGSSSATTNTIVHLDDVYTDQWLGLTPTFSIGTEENAPAVTAAYKLLLKVGK